MDYDNINKRISEIEEVLGVDNFSKKKTIPEEIELLNKTLKDDCNARLLMTLPSKKLELLNKIATETSHHLFGSLSEKIESVKFAEALITQRTQLISQYEALLKNALDTESYSKIIELQPQLDEEIQVCEELLQKWKEEIATFLKFREQYSLVIQMISKRMLELQLKIQLKESSKNIED